MGCSAIGKKKDDIKVDHECGVRMRNGRNWYIEVLEKSRILSPLLCVYVYLRARVMMPISSANLQGH